MRLLSGILLLAFLGVLFLFAYQNQAATEVHFLDRAIRFPLAGLAVAAYVLGMMSGWSVVGFFRRNLHHVQEPAD
jgi:uncharacterized integral membrane protein